MKKIFAFLLMALAGTLMAATQTSLTVVKDSLLGVAKSHYEVTSAGAGMDAFKVLDNTLGKLYDGKSDADLYVTVGQKNSSGKWTYQDVDLSEQLKAYNKGKLADNTLNLGITLNKGDTLTFFQGSTDRRYRSEYKDSNSFGTGYYYEIDFNILGGYDGSLDFLLVKSTAPTPGPFGSPLPEALGTLAIAGGALAYLKRRKALKNKPAPQA